MCGGDRGSARDNEEVPEVDTGSGQWPGEARVRNAAEPCTYKWLNGTFYVMRVFLQLQNKYQPPPLTTSSSYPPARTREYAPSLLRPWMPAT